MKKFIFYAVALLSVALELEWLTKAFRKASLEASKNKKQ